MAKSKKTVSVSELKEHANNLLTLDECSVITKEWKEGVCSMIEKTLHLSGNYNGFYFLDSDNCEINTFGYFTRKYF